MCDIIVQGGGHTVSPEIPFPRQSPILNKTSVQQLPICTRPVDNRIPSRASVMVCLAGIVESQNRSCDFSPTGHPEVERNNVLG